MFKIRRFGIMKTATTVAVLYMVTIAIFLVPLALLVLAVGTNVQGGTGDVSVGVGGVMAFGLIAIVVYGAATWVFTAVACALYNLVAGWVGGVEILLEPVAPAPPPPVWGAVAPPPAPPATPPAG